MPSLSTEPLLSEEDYGAIEAAVMETARGRWFLAEYARRNRNADTETVLGAIRRLERLVHSAGTFDARDEVTRGMADIAQAIAAAQASPVTVEATVEERATENEDDPVAVLQVARPEPIEAEEAASAAVISPAEPPVSEQAAGNAEPGTETVHDDAVIGDAASPAGDLESEMEPVALPPVAVISEDFEIPTVADEAGMQETALAAENEDSDESRLVAAAMTAAEAEPFPILELDEEATEALLTSDVPRQELILPANHLSTQRWHKDAGEEGGHGGDYRLDRWALPADRSEIRPAAIAIEHEPADTSATVAPREMGPEPTKPAGLVTFIDEEPVDDERSVFTAPLRLEPEGVVDQAQAVSPGIRPAAAATERIAVPRLTIGEIEAMPFAKKAALFS